MKLLSVSLMASLIATGHANADAAFEAELQQRQQTAALQAIQATQTTEFLLEYGRQASEDYEAQMPEARGRAIRERYLERQQFEEQITGGDDD